MQTQLDLDQAVCRIFGNQLHKISHPSKQWNTFTCFQAVNQQQPYLFKLLEVPASYHISQEIYQKKLKRFGRYLHKVKFFFVERSFQASYYVLKAQENIISLQSMITLAKESGENIQEQLIYEFLEFGNQLQKFQHSKELYFNSDQIGRNSNNQYKIANYQLYFQRTQSQHNLRKDIKNVLFSLITLSSLDQSPSIMETYSASREKYNESLTNIVEKLLEDQYKSSQIETMISGYHQNTNQSNGNNTTITESYLEDMDNISQVLANDQLSCHDTSINESMKVLKKNKQTQKKKRFVILFIFFITILLGIGAVTFEYLGKKNIVCGQSEFLNKQANKCLSCASSCQRCQQGGDDMCYSCRGNMYLLVKSTHDNNYVGSCAKNCSGQILNNTKICIINKQQTPNNLVRQKQN